MTRLPVDLVEEALRQAEENEVDLDNSQITELAMAIAIDRVAQAIRSLSEAVKELP